MCEEKQIYSDLLNDVGCIFCVNHLPRGSNSPFPLSNHQPSTLRDDSLNMKVLPGFEPHQTEHLYCRPDITAPSLFNGQIRQRRGRPAAWTLSLCEHYPWHFNDPHSKFPNIISLLDGLYWSACYSECLLVFYVQEQKSRPWKEVGRVS